VVKTPKLYFYDHTGFCGALAKRSQTRNASYNYQSERYLRKYDGGLILHAEHHQVSNQKSMVFGGTIMEWVDLFARSRDTLDIFEIKKQVKLSWPKTSREWKNSSPFHDLLCLKRISEYREFEQKRSMERYFMERFSLILRLIFISYRNLIIHGGPQVIHDELTIRKFKMKGSTSSPDLLKKSCSFQDLSFRRQMN